MYDCAFKYLYRYSYICIYLKNISVSVVKTINI